MDRDVRHSSSGKGAPTILYLNKEEDEPRSRERWGVREPLILQDGSRVSGLVEDAHYCFSSNSHLHPGDAGIIALGLARSREKTLHAAVPHKLPSLVGSYLGHPYQ